MCGSVGRVSEPKGLVAELCVEMLGCGALLSCVLVRELLCAAWDLSRGIAWFRFGAGFCGAAEGGCPRHELQPVFVLS